MSVSGRPRSARTRAHRARTYAFVGAVLSQGSPLGALLLRAAVQGIPPQVQLAQDGLLYAYMSLATLLVFTMFGYVLGRNADSLARQRHNLRKANHRLRWLSDIDALTGLLNRRAVRRRLRAEAKRARRDGTTVALVLLDLDHFKKVNDRYGHPAGDRVLRRVGRCARRLARASDSVGRVGGEEFLAVLPATSLHEAWQFAERLRRTIGLPPADAATPTVTASLGLSIYAPTERVDIDAALSRVDRALYQAKAQGRNSVSMLTDETRAHA